LVVLKRASDWKTPRGGRGELAGEHKGKYRRNRKHDFWGGGRGGGLGGGRGTQSNHEDGATEETYYNATSLA